MMHLDYDDDDDALKWLTWYQCPELCTAATAANVKNKHDYNVTFVITYLNNSNEIDLLTGAVAVYLS